MNMQFYKNLKRARVRMGKSQIEVAKAVGISNAALSNYETGYREPDLDTLCALSRYYGLTLDELLDVNGEQHEPIYDLSPVLKNKYIAYKGEVFELKDSQKRALLRELDNLFTKFPTTPIGIVSPTPWYKFPTTAPNNDMELYVQKLELICKRRDVVYTYNIINAKIVL